ncbi:hypothetical protein Fmac_008464 [Flemingia macrophylla]|uniref:cellulase n=1 Tax=Flemingia macrophylla TaxID=520843 RepID=A0ABD1MXJ2_9FABA
MPSIIHTLQNEAAQQPWPQRSLVFKEVDSTYSSTLLKHAKQLFSFANKNRGSYSENIPEVQTYYNLTGYGDELLWAASWLYHVTGDDSYLEFVTGQDGEDYAQWGSPTWFSWDNKLAGTQVLRKDKECSTNLADKLQTNKESYRRKDIPVAEINKLRDKIRVPKANYCS